MSGIRREYGHLTLCEKEASPDPIILFEQWFKEGLKTEKSDPTAMVLSTVDENGHPDSRVVLLKELKEGAFIFYTNYQSAKAVQLDEMPYAALNFYWPQMARQVRIRGPVSRIPPEASDAYFASRPRLSQLSAMASAQSQVLESRLQLEQRLNELVTQYLDVPIPRPKSWGGYELVPDEMEFWQGRDNRLHDRLRYQRSKKSWFIERLAP